MDATFERFSLHMTVEQARGASHAGDCTADVEALLTLPRIARQLDRIGADAVRAELREYGAWDDTDLADDAENRARIVWIAAVDICEAHRARQS
jgi:hypothetical protein